MIFIGRSTYELLQTCTKLFRYSSYAAEGYMRTDTTPTEEEKSYMNNNFWKKIPHNVQKCLIHFILLARNSVFVQFFEKNVIVLFLFQASIFKLFIGL